MHTCNPFCQGGIHAILVDPSPAELGAAAFAKIAGVVANSAGLTYHGFTVIRDDALLGVPGTPTKFGATRGRAVVWARRPGE